MRDRVAAKRGWFQSAVGVEYHRDPLGFRAKFGPELPPGTGNSRRRPGSTWAWHMPHRQKWRPGSCSGGAFCVIDRLAYRLASRTLLAQIYKGREMAEASNSRAILKESHEQLDA